MLLKLNLHRNELSVDDTKQSNITLNYLPSNKLHFTKSQLNAYVKGNPLQTEIPHIGYNVDNNLNLAIQKDPFNQVYIANGKLGIRHHPKKIAYCGMV